jgi:hypothetical protein
MRPTAIVFCGLDFLWPGFVAKGYYQLPVGALFGSGFLVPRALT